MRRPPRRWLLFWPLIALAGALAGCPPPVLTRPDDAAAFPTRACAAAWAGRDDGEYDPRRDRRACPQGNCGYAEYAARVDRPACYKQWTVLLYMAADVDEQLAPWALENLAEMEAPRKDARTASTPATDVIVQLDSRDDARFVRRLHMFQSDAAAPVAEAALHLTPADLRSPIVALLPQPTPAPPQQRLRDFLLWGIRAYPAQHYLVLIWGHGQGWGADPQQPLDGPPGTPFLGWSGGLALDFRQRTYLGIPALHAVLREAAAATGRALDIYAADACLMQSIEVTDELHDSARYLVGTTEIEPLGGLPYGDIVARLNQPARAAPPACADAPDREACAVASLIPAAYAEAVALPPRRELLGRRSPRSAVLSALRSDALADAMVPALAELGQALATALRDDSYLRIALRDQLASGGAVLGNSREIGAWLDDLEALLATPQARAAAARNRSLLPLLHKARAALAHTLLATSVPGRGLSVWIPPTRQDYLGNLQRYGSARFFQYGQSGAPPALQPGPWAQFLAALWQ
jgi:hypothetical protein